MSFELGTPATHNRQPTPTTTSRLNIWRICPIFRQEGDENALLHRRSMLMESSNTTVASHDYTDARRVLSQCWIFTPERGLRPMTLHGNGSSIAVDGRRLTRWCVLDDDVTRSIIGYVYCAEEPSPELRSRVTKLARERFGPALAHE